MLWTGKPKPERLARRALGTAGMGVAGVAFSLFWLWMATTPLRHQATRQSSPDVFNFLFPLFGLFFLGYYAWLMLAPWLEFQRAPHIYYALTDRRALIVTVNARDTVQSVMPSEFALARQQNSDGSSDLVLKREVRARNWLHPQPRVGLYTIEIGFFGIDNAREVERLARDLA